MLDKPLTRRAMLAKSMVVGAGMGLVTSCQRARLSSSDSAKRPNIIVFLTDDQGYGDLGCYGNKHLSTPNIDRLARRGIKLNQHYSGSPLCAPARAAFLTGRYNHRTGAISVESNRGMDRIALQEKTIADYFHQAGYATGMIGKWHNGLFDNRYHPKNRGFQEFVGFLNGGMGYYDWILDYNGKVKYSDGNYLTDLFTDESVSFIERHKTEPFFLYVSYNAPHTPLEAPESLTEKYKEMGRFNEAVSLIYAMIEQMDAGIGKVLDTLERLSLDENTIVLFTSDNGPWLGGNVHGSLDRYNGPFRGMKNESLEGGIRVPAIISWPAALPSSQTSNEMIHFVDWLPTFLAAANISSKPSLPFDGTNVLPMLREDIIMPPRKLFWQHNRNEPIWNCNSAMRDGPWKLVWPYPDEARYKSSEDQQWYEKLFEQPHQEMEVSYSYLAQDVPEPEKPDLYNLEKDPQESHDLSAEYPERVEKMKTELLNWFEEIETERRNIKWT